MTWVRGNGAQSVYATLLEGESHVQRTHAGDVWLVRGMQSRLVLERIAVVARDQKLHVDASKPRDLSDVYQIAAPVVGRC